MFTLEDMLTYFQACTDPQEKTKVFRKLHQYLQYWNNMSKDDVDRVFEKNGITI
jgi:hypothetical protein